MLQDGLCVRQLVAAGAGFVRIKRDSAGVPFLLNTQNEIHQIVPENDTASLRLFANAAAIGGAPYTLGFAIGPDDAMYVVGNDTDGKTGRCTVRTNADGAWTTLVETAWFPLSNTQYDHRCNGIIVSPDNKYVFFNSGSRTEHGEVQDNGGAFPGLREAALTSTVFRIPRTARGLILPNDEAALNASGYVYARGLRNAFDLAFDNNGRLLAIDNGPDADFSEELNVLTEGAHYGFPWRFGAQDNPQRDPAYDPQRDVRLNSDFVAVQKGLYRNDPEFPQPPGVLTDPLLNTGPDANQFRADDGSVQTGPLSTFTPHRSPLGLVWDAQNRLPGAYKGSGFVASWGSAGGTLSDRGQDLLLLRAAGAQQISVTRIARGFNRPIDAVLQGNVLYVLDWEGDGSVWEITIRASE
jgi:glucose/arabinose dehydrogenase